ncbi:NHL repeat-containing protein, partial [Flavobacterium sp. AG291]|uniref:NHL repeat-containing protein n=1 Tax=Flavobacterium sp. AG291 TaxID=2184000 RepID=UPI0018F45BC6
RITPMGYSITPSLPSGLTFSGVTGQVSGTPTVLSYPADYTVTATNNGGSTTATFNLSVTSTASVITGLVSSVTSTGAAVAGNVTSDGGITSTERGICYGTAINPDITGTKVTDMGTGLGTFSGALSSLSPSTTYYARAYTTNSRGTTYGENIIFTTIASAPTALSYSGPNDYLLNSAITVLAPTVTGTPGFGLALTSSNASVSTFAGTGSSGTADGSGTSASFNGINKIVFDSANNAYVADGSSHKIRKITPDGIVSTFAGTGSAGSDNGPRTNATFNGPEGLAIDASGNLYVADYSNNRIRKITPSGVVSTFAGSGTAGATNGTGTAATFQDPRGITIDPSGNLYIAEYSNNRIRKITPSGVVTTLAGSGSQSSTDGTGTSAAFYNPYDIAYDAATNSLYVTEFSSRRIRKVTLDGVVTTLAGNGAGYADGTGTAALFNNPTCIASDSKGNLYVSDNGNFRLRRVIASTGAVSTVAGDGTSNYADGIGTAAKFKALRGVGMNSIGELYVAEDYRIRRITPMGYSITPSLPS